MRVCGCKANAESTVGHGGCDGFKMKKKNPLWGTGCGCEIWRYKKNDYTSCSVHMDAKMKTGSGCLWGLLRHLKDSSSDLCWL